MKIIIANTNVGALLKAADGILSQYGRDDVPEKIKGQATLSAIKEMGMAKSFSVCTVDRLAEMNEINIASEHRHLFSTLHCVDWADMHQDTREYVMALLIDYFKGNIVMSQSNYERAD